MPSLMISVVAILYYVCFALLLGFALFIIALPKVRKRPRPDNTDLLRRQRRAFLFLLVSLLVWQATLFLEPHATLPWVQLWLSRTNFTAIAVATPLLGRFVGLVARDANTTATVATVTVVPPGWSPGWSRSLQLETALLIALTLLTPLIVETEAVVAGVSITRFGLLFPLYLLHVLVYLAATIAQTVQARRMAGDSASAGRNQLTLIGVGIVATAGIALVTNALLPYLLGDFRFCDLGTLSTLLFLIAIAYAVFVHGLFDLRVMVGKALVGGLLLAFVLGGYSSSVFLITQYLSGSGSEDNSGNSANKGDGSTSGNTGNVAQFVVLFLAFSFDPLRRFLEDKADDLLFGDKDQRKRPSRRRRNRRRLAKGNQSI